MTAPAGPLVAVVGLETGFLIAAGVALVAILASLLSSSVRNLRTATVPEAPPAV